MSLAAAGSIAPETACASPTPCITLLSERMSVNTGTALEPDLREIDAPLIRLGFDYGGVRVRASDPRSRIAPRGGPAIQRDAGAEM